MRFPGFLAIFSAACLLVPSSFAFAAAADHLAAQREGFLNARKAVQRGDLDSFHSLSRKLKDYPLYPYLRFDYLSRNPEKASSEEIQEFLSLYGDTPLADRLKSGRLSYLARSGRWKEFLASYDGSGGTELRCHYVRGRLETGDHDGLWEDVEELWLVGVSQPDACNPAFEAWRQRGDMTREKVLARIELAMEGRQGQLISFLERSLPADDKAWVAKWRRVDNNPEVGLTALLKDGHAVRDAILFSIAVRRLARENPERAEQLWLQGERFKLDERQRAQVERSIAMSMALKRLPGAASRLATLDSKDDPEARHWRVRSALWVRDWEAVLAAIDALTPEEQETADWLYWRGRALEALGRKNDAVTSFKKAADCRCYYGFLAADKVGIPPALNNVPLAVEKEDLNRLSQIPGVVRTKELEALGMDAEARREWWVLIRRLDADELRVAAKLASSWGWHAQTIFTLGRAESWDDLELRFPTPFRDTIVPTAERRKLDGAFVYALMRQESAFQPTVRSRVGAMGLMQLMPATARETARQINRPLRNVSELLTVGPNVELGTAHLRHLMDRYDGNKLYTIAAYNAGAHRVARWRPKEEKMPADIWVANVPFHETRDYLERILTYTRIYEWRLGKKQTSLAWLLADLEPEPADPSATAVADGS